MIYIIGGAPRVGKSIVAKRLAQDTAASFVSTDDICDKLSDSLSETERAIKFPLPGFSGTASENVLTPEKRVELSIISAKSVEPEIDRIISNAITKDESLVIEGVHFLPEYVRELLSKYGSDKIQALFVGSTYVKAVVDGIMKNTSPDNWMRDSHPDVIRQVAEFVSALSRYLEKEAEKYHLAYKERTVDFERDVVTIKEMSLHHLPPESRYK
jgi:2-phosphoglycerate kinase